MIPLSDEELAIVRHLADGMTYRQAATAESLGVEAVKSRMRRVAEKTGALNTVNLVHILHQAGVLK